MLYYDLVFFCFGLRQEIWIYLRERNYSLSLFQVHGIKVNYNVKIYKIFIIKKLII